jgi:signal transduction histidine kinase
MKLATRLSAFFLAALAVILIGNSILLFLIARFYLYRQFDDQLQFSLHTLVAAVEVEDDDVKWEPSDHTVTLGTENGVEDVRWVVADEQGRVIAQSRNLQADTDAAALFGLASGSRDPRGLAGWRFLEHRLAAPHPKPAAERSELEHPAITVFVGRRLADVQAALGWLGLALLALPALCWLVAALLGQAYCRQAIAPVSKMAESARTLRADSVVEHLPAPQTGDELEELGVAFNQLLDRLFSAYQQQRRFAGDAAHLLRTPLTVLQGQVEVALRRRRPAEEYEAVLRIASEEIQGLGRTVETLLRLAQPEASTEGLELQTMDVAAWLEDYLQRWRSHARWLDIQITVERGLSCRSSPNLLVEVLDVLISNALKYSSPGSPVEIRASCREQALVLEIEDRGPGISAADRDAIFRPFYRSQAARQSGAAGVGLGLAIAQRMVRSLGGTLQCDSDEGRGSRFLAIFPQARRDVSSAASSAMQGAQARR